MKKILRVISAMRRRGNEFRKEEERESMLRFVLCARKWEEKEKGEIHFKEEKRRKIFLMLKKRNELRKQRILKNTSPSLPTARPRSCFRRISDSAADQCRTSYRFQHLAIRNKTVYFNPSGKKEWRRRRELIFGESKCLLYSISCE